MMTSDWMRDISFDMLPPQHKKLAEIIGVEAALKLCETCGGMALYIPMLDSVHTAVRAEMIRRAYNGENTAHLARRFGLTVRAVQLIVQGENPQIDGQINMLDGYIG